MGGRNPVVVQHRTEKKMKLTDLKNEIEAHAGIFHCIRRGGLANKPESKEVAFEHVYEPPRRVSAIPPTAMLKEFYETFGSLTLYFHKESGDAAFYIANPDEWDRILESFRNWMEDVVDDDPEWLPYWVDDCLAIGEIPQSGNYLLVPANGEKAGHIFEFEHDGYEFIEHASNLQEFVTRMLSPDSSALTRMAAHMCFIEGDPMEQWWIDEMRDNRGRIVKTST